MTEVCECGHEKEQHKWFVQIGNHKKQFYYSECRDCKCKKFKPKHPKDCKGCPDCPGIYTCKCGKEFNELNTEHECKPKTDFNNLKVTSLREKRKILKQDFKDGLFGALDIFDLIEQQDKEFLQRLKEDRNKIFLEARRDKVFKKPQMLMWLEGCLNELDDKLSGGL